MKSIRSEAFQVKEYPLAYGYKILQLLSQVRPGASSRLTFRRTISTDDDYAYFAQTRDKHQR
jgi:hypothetical protein